VWAELASLFPSREALLVRMVRLDIGFSPIEREAAALEGASGRKYCTRDGKRTRVIADFLIGAHAKVQCDRLLASDRGFYRDFKKVPVLEPSLSCNG